MSGPEAQWLLLGATWALSLLIVVQTLRLPQVEAGLKALIVLLVLSGAAHGALLPPLALAGSEAGLAWRLLAAPGAGLLWLLMRRLFDDDFRWRRRHLLGLALVVLIAALPLLPVPDEVPLRRISSRLITLYAWGCALHLLWRLVAGWRDDLEPWRRTLRVLLAGGGALYMALVLLRLQLLPPVAVTLLPAVLQIGLKMVWLTWLGDPAGRLVPLLQSREIPAHHPAQTGIVVVPDIPADAGEAREKELATRIVAAMEQEYLYRRTGLRIQDLADHLGLPEYRVRRLVNHHLGYRNFQSFLNHYRLREVAQRLADPQQAQLSIMVIALDAGYASLGPFNRAFRDAHGLTPTEFRRHAGGAAPADMPDPVDQDRR